LWVLASYSANSLRSSAIASNFFGSSGFGAGAGVGVGVGGLTAGLALGALG